MMRQPGFWRADPARPGLCARALAPLGALYGWATARRLARGRRWRAPVPVICVGNLHVGGTGKTPTVIALAARLAARGVAVHVVSRGYGGRLTGPVQVDPRAHSAADVGDEPLLMTGFAPVWVSDDRAAGIAAAAAAGAEAVLLDDGFQDGSVAHDLALVVVSAVQGFGNGRVLPAGPLRERVAVGLKRADLVLSVGSAADQALFARRWGAHLPCPSVPAALQTLRTGMDWRGLRALAFAGIGHPERFFASLRAEGADLLRAEALTDHQPLTPALMKRLEMEALALGAQMVTTEKDAVRLPTAFRQRVLTLPVRLEPDDWNALDTALERVLARHDTPLQAT